VLRACAEQSVAAVTKTVANTQQPDVALVRRLKIDEQLRLVRKLGWNHVVGFHHLR
jgi:hypothetical protein